MEGEELTDPRKNAVASEFVDVIRVPYKNAPMGVERRVLDPGLLRNEPVVAAYDQYIDELYERIRDGDTPKWRAQCKKAFEDEDTEKLAKLLAKGVDYDQAMEFLFKTMDRRALRAERSQEIAMRSDNVVTKQELNKTLGDVFDVLSECIKDQSLLHDLISRISQRISSSGS